MENLQLLCPVLPATHANDFHVSKILRSFCTRSNAPPRVSACPPCCQLSGLKGRTVAPRSQITGQEQAMCSMQPEAFPNCPFLSPFPTLQSDSQSSFEVFSTKLFPMEWFLNSRGTFSWKIRVIQHWSGGESFSQSTGDTHLATCFPWFRSGPWPWFSHVLDEWPNHWAIKAITSALWPY